MPRKEERGIKWIFGVVILLVSFLILMGYAFTCFHLRFHKALGLQTDDFNYPLTNEYNTIKWWFIVFLPVMLGMIPLIMLALFLQYAYMSDTSQKDTFYSRSHLIIVLLYLGILITGLVYLSLDWVNSNTVLHGGESLASDLRYCCAIDVLPTPPGKTLGCPYINACGIDPISTHQLRDDPYFILTFTFNIALVVLSILQVVVGAIILS